jgi:hypothetical protein
VQERARAEEAALEESAAQDVPQDRFEEAQVMLWLLASDLTNPSLEDMLAFTKSQTFNAAYAELEKRIAMTGRLDEVYENIEKPLIPVLREMEKHGVCIDKEALERLNVKYRTELTEIEQRIFKECGREFNVSSPKQLGEVLFDEMQTQNARRQKWREADIHRPALYERIRTRKAARHAPDNRRHPRIPPSAEAARYLYREHTAAPGYGWTPACAVHSDRRCDRSHGKR